MTRRQLIAGAWYRAAPRLVISVTCAEMGYSRQDSRPVKYPDWMRRQLKNIELCEGCRATQLGVSALMADLLVNIAHKISRPLVARILQCGGDPEFRRDAVATLGLSADDEMRVWRAVLPQR